VVDRSLQSDTIRCSVSAALSLSLLLRQGAVVHAVYR
jgi:hypothetical protein